MNCIEVRDFLLSLGGKILPPINAGEYARYIDDDIENIIWQSKDKEVHVNYWLDNEASLHISFFNIGAILVIFELDGDDAILSVCNCDVYDATHTEELWGAFKTVTTTLDKALKEKNRTVLYLPF